ncbi:MAG: ion transporter [Xenococcaceae cyanobacterium]
MQTAIARIVKSNVFEYSILGVIIFAGILVGIQTNPELAAKYSWPLMFLDHIIVGIFVAELILKIIAEGNKPWRYFQDPWNVFDFIIIVAFLIPIDNKYVIVLRLLRILRFLRLVRVLPRLQVIVNAILASIPSMGYITLLLALVFYIYGVLATFLFSANDPVHFSSLLVSMLTLFRVVTFEDWTDIMYINMYGCDKFRTGNPYPADLCTNPSGLPLLSAFFFVSFALIGAMIFINLFIGVITTSIDQYQQQKVKEEEMLRSENKKDDVETDLLQLQRQISAIEMSLEQIRTKISSK